MDLERIYKFGCIKNPLDKVFDRRSLVPKEYLMDWLKDTHDYRRSHSEKELRASLSLSPEQVLDWLEEAAEFAWEAKQAVKWQPTGG
jgi:hypothetical protein